MGLLLGFFGLLAGLFGFVWIIFQIAVILYHVVILVIGGLVCGVGLVIYAIVVKQYDLLWVAIPLTVICGGIVFAVYWEQKKRSNFDMTA